MNISYNQFRLGLAGGLVFIVIVIALAVSGAFSTRDKLPSYAGSEHYGAFTACTEYIADALSTPIGDIEAWSTYRVEKPYDETENIVKILSWVLVPRTIGGDKVYQYECSLMRQNGIWVLMPDGLVLKP
jgi:hypothetical protein